MPSRNITVQIAKSPTNGRERFYVSQVELYHAVLSVRDEIYTSTWNAFREASFDLKADQRFPSGHLHGAFVTLPEFISAMRYACKNTELEEEFFNYDFQLLARKIDEKIKACRALDLAELDRDIASKEKRLSVLKARKRQMERGSFAPIEAPNPKRARLEVQLREGDSVRIPPPLRRGDAEDEEDSDNL